MRIIIPGTPQQQGSKRFVRGRGIEANKNLAPWRADAIHAIQQQFDGREVITGPIRVQAICRYVRPKSHYRTGRNAHLVRENAPYWKASAPDLDKLQRAIGDALTQSGAIVDDSQIVAWDASKVWGQSAFVELLISVEVTP